MRGRQKPDDLRLDLVGVLVLVNHDVLIILRKGFPDLFVVLEKLPQINKKVVVIQQRQAVLVADIFLFHMLDDLRPLGELRVFFTNNIVNTDTFVHTFRNDAKQGIFLGETFVELFAHLGAHEIDGILGVVLVEDGKETRQVNGFGVAAQDRIGERVKGPTETWLQRESKSSSARLSISREARRVKVNSKMRSGATPFSTRCAVRKTKTRVFPLPAPAITRNGPSVAKTASSWAGFSSFL
jgi:hypothetical protein